MCAVETRQIKFIRLHFAVQIAIIARFGAERTPQYIAVLSEFADGFVRRSRVANAKSRVPFARKIGVGRLGECRKALILTIMRGKSNRDFLRGDNPFAFDNALAVNRRDVRAENGELNPH